MLNLIGCRDVNRGHNCHMTALGNHSRNIQGTGKESFQDVSRRMEFVHKIASNYILWHDLPWADHKDYYLLSDLYGRNESNRISIRPSANHFPCIFYYMRADLLARVDDRALV